MSFIGCSYKMIVNCIFLTNNLYKFWTSKILIVQFMVLKKLKNMQVPTPQLICVF